MDFLSMFDENYKTNITEYYTVQYSLIAFGQNKNPLLSNIEKRNQKIDS
jgi:hypothetical protein